MAKRARRVCVRVYVWMDGRAWGGSASEEDGMAYIEGGNRRYIAPVVRYTRSACA